MQQATARAERLARNDATFRAANERIDEVAKSVDDYRDTLLRGTRRTKRRASSKDHRYAVVREGRRHGAGRGEAGPASLEQPVNEAEPAS